MKIKIEFEDGIESYTRILKFGESIFLYHEIKRERIILTASKVNDVVDKQIFDLTKDEEK